jgi:hypothetical protein
MTESTTAFGRDAAGSPSNPPTFRQRARTLAAAHPLTVAVLGLVVGLLGALMIGVLLSRTGDEPPIRVKGGSIELELLEPDGLFSRKWNEDGNTKKKWTLGGKRKDDAYQILVAYTGGACRHGGYTQGRIVKLHYSKNSGLVQVKAEDKRTKVDADADMARLPDSKVLVYPATEAGPSGYITKIEVDNAPFCDFDQDEKKLLQMVLLEF